MTVYDLIQHPLRPKPTQQQIDDWNAGRIIVNLKCSKCNKLFGLDYHIDYPLGVLALYVCDACENSA